MRKRDRFAVLAAGASLAFAVLHCGGGAHDAQAPAPTGTADGGESRAARRAVLEIEANHTAEQLDAARANYALAVDSGDAQVIATARATLAAAADEHEATTTTLRSLASAEVDAGISPREFEEREFETGSRLRYGLNVSLLQLTFSRPDDEAARLRNFRPKLALVPPHSAAHPGRSRLTHGTSA